MSYHLTGNIANKVHHMTLLALFGFSAPFDAIKSLSNVSLCLFWTLWSSFRLDYVLLGWALQLPGIGNKQVPLGHRSISSSTRFCLAGHILTCS